MALTRCWLVAIAWLAGVTGFVHPAAGQAHELDIDFQQTNGVIRPLHGVNLGPLCYRGTVDLTEYHRELKIPLTRLHDVVWVNAEAVDIHTIFPDADRDPARADSYDFRATDDYIQGIRNAGSGIVYRLGESIEHTSRKYHVHPPLDPGKWAAICAGIIAHYNRGWASGFAHGIRYWEIWNEPDVRPSMWTGTDQEFFRLFEITAKLIKQRFPEVKVGGPAVGGTGDFQGKSDDFKPAPFLKAFLEFCQREHVPLDFFSWHRYTSQPWDLPRRARAMRRLIDQHGFAQTESHLNEWNYLPNDDWRPMLREGQGASREAWYRQMGGPAGAAFAASALMLLQDVPVDAANYYTGEIQGFGLFDFNGVPKATFYAFKAFRQLLDTPVRVAARGEVQDQLALLAGLNADRTRAALLISNFALPAKLFRAACRNRPWNGPTRFERSVLDEGHRLTLVQAGTLEGTDGILEFELPAAAVSLIRLRPENATRD